MRSTDADRSEVVVDRLIRLPPIERMAPRTVGASLPLVHIKMTALTALREITVLVLDVAFPTALFTVETFQGVSALALMIEIDLTPSDRAMTLVAGLRELSFVEILMAICAAGVDRFELPLTMTAVTVEPLVFPLKGEAAEPMVKCLDRPRLRTLVTANTINPGELSLVLVLVAKDTLGARIILKLCPLRVTAITGLLRVSSF